MPVRDGIKQAVRARAQYLCEYCHSSERLSASRFTIDHIRPQSLGGSDMVENLALTCRRCNERRYNVVASIDPETQETVPVFHPRQQQWNEHFIWTGGGVVIAGITAIGRATCVLLDLNDTRYPKEDFIRETRQFWIKTRLHPPPGDLLQA